LVLNVSALEQSAQPKQVLEFDLLIELRFYIPLDTVGDFGDLFSQSLGLVLKKLTQTQQ